MLVCDQLILGLIPLKVLSSEPNTPDSVMTTIFLQNNPCSKEKIFHASNICIFSLMISRFHTIVQSTYYEKENIYIYIYIVRTRFVSNHNRVGFTRKKTHTISFVEHGFERLGPGHQAVSFSWCSCMVELSSPLESFSWRWAGRLWFLAILPSPFSRLLTFPFILAFVYCPSSTCRVNLPRTDTCPISLYPKSLEVVVKAKECDSVRRRALNGSEDCFPQIF